MTTHSKRYCQICGKKLGANPNHVKTADNKLALVGSECYKQIKNSCENGFMGLYPIENTDELVKLLDQEKQ